MNIHHHQWYDIYIYIQWVNRTIGGWFDKKNWKKIFNKLDQQENKKKCLQSREKKSLDTYNF